MTRTPPLLPLRSRPQRALRTPPAPGTIGWASGSAAIALSIAAISTSASKRVASRSYRLVANTLARTVYTIRNFRIARQEDSAVRDTRRLRGFGFHRQILVAYEPVGAPSCTAIAGTRHRRGAGPRRREGSSCHGQSLVADKVKAYPLRPWPIEEERGGRLNRVLAQLLPRIPPVSYTHLRAHETVLDLV